MLQEMHCFQGKGPVICQKGPLQVQANFHFQKGSLHARQCEAFFGAKRSCFGGKRSLQKSKSHLFAQ